MSTAHLELRLLHSKNIPMNRGIGGYTQDPRRTGSLTAIAQEAGMQVAYYAIGDGAIDRCLNAVESTKRLSDNKKQNDNHTG